MPPQKPTTDLRPHLTPQQLATRWQVTTDYLYRAVIGQTDGVPAIRLGTGSRARLRIRLSDVEAFEASRIVQYSSP